MATLMQRQGQNQFDNPGRIESNMMNELLLVVSVLGSHVTEEDEEGGISERFVPVADCLNWLQDLQRALRSDKDDLRPIANQLGTWKVVEEKLIPIALVKRDDSDTILTLAKLFVILTKPMTKAAKQAALINIDVKSKKFSEETIQDQVKLKVGGKSCRGRLSDIWQRRAFRLLEGEPCCRIQRVYSTPPTPTPTNLRYA